MPKKKMFQTIDLCRFCTKEYPKCGAKPIYSEAIRMKSGQLDSDESVIACDKYESPVEILKRKFH